MTAIDVSRNYCLYAAEELVRKDARSEGKTVDTKLGKDRGVYVNNEPAYLQQHRYDPRGTFCGAFADLKLP